MLNAFTLHSTSSSLYAPAPARSSALAYTTITPSPSPSRLIRRKIFAGNWQTGKLAINDSICNSQTCSQGCRLSQRVQRLQLRIDLQLLSLICLSLSLSHSHVVLLVVPQPQCELSLCEVLTDKQSMQEVLYSTI